VLGKELPVISETGKKNYCSDLNTLRLICIESHESNLHLCTTLLCTTLFLYDIMLIIFSNLHVFLSNGSHPLTSYTNHFNVVVFFILGYSPVSEFYALTFRNTLHVPSS
jgi:hypothetical protein